MLAAGFRTNVHLSTCGPLLSRSSRELHVREDQLVIKPRLAVYSARTVSSSSSRGDNIRCLPRNSCQRQQVSGWSRPALRLRDSVVAATGTPSKDRRRTTMAGNVFGELLQSCTESCYCIYQNQRAHITFMARKCTSLWYKHQFSHVLQILLHQQL